MLVQFQSSVLKWLSHSRQQNLETFICVHLQTINSAYFVVFLYASFSYKINPVISFSDNDEQPHGRCPLASVCQNCFGKLQ